MDILEALAAESDQIGLSALSERVDLHTATVHRLLSTLTARGYARHDARSGQYAPGPQLLTISLAALGARWRDVVREAHPLLRQLASTWGETASLVVGEEQVAFCIDQVGGRRSRLTSMQVGTRVPLCCTACGKALLAHRSAAVLDRYLAVEGFASDTSRALTLPAALRHELACIREQGFAVDRGEPAHESCCVAVPILDHDNRAHVAIGLCCAASRFTSQYQRQLTQALLSVADDLSARLYGLVPCSMRRGPARIHDRTIRAPGADVAHRRI